MIKNMTRLNQQGDINPLLIPLILVAFLLIGAVGFGFWANGERQDYKDNVNEKIVAANAVAVKAAELKKDKAFTEQLKNPLVTYNGPVSYGSVQLNYPRTWSAYLADEGKSNSIDGYFSPNYVASINGQESVFALRMQVINQAYDNVLQQYSGQVKQGKITSVPYKFPKVASVVGVKLSGALTPTKNGTMIVMPVRDKTLKLWTESAQYQPDYNNFILPNFTFSP